MQRTRSQRPRSTSSTSPSPSPAARTPPHPHPHPPTTSASTTTSSHLPRRKSKLPNHRPSLLRAQEQPQSQSLPKHLVRVLAPQPRLSAHPRFKPSASKSPWVAQINTKSTLHRWQRQLASVPPPLPRQSLISATATAKKPTAQNRRRRGYSSHLTLPGTDADVSAEETLWLRVLRRQRPLHRRL